MKKETTKHVYIDLSKVQTDSFNREIIGNHVEDLCNIIEKCLDDTCHPMICTYQNEEDLTEIEKGNHELLTLRVSLP